MPLRNVRILLLVLLALEVALLLFGPRGGDHLPAIESALAAGEKPEWWDAAAMGIRSAAWINGGLLILLLLTSKWWTRPLTISPISPFPFPISAPRWFWPLAILAVLACLGLRLPLASKSLWWDEAWVVLQVSHGKWRPDPKQPDKLKFLAHDWKRCAFYYQKPTNHAPMSLAQKASFSAWRKLSGAPREEFSDLAARVPALIASCAAVLLLALLLRSWGCPGGGIVAAFLLALHPWHIRYGVDARAYAFVVPLCVGGMLAITRIVQTGGASIRPWVCWGLIEFLWLWAYPNAVLDVAALNLVALVLLIRHHAEARSRWSAILRLAATNLFAAVCLIQVFLPNVMQAVHWAGSENVAQPVDRHLIKSTLSQLVFGVERAWPGSIEAEGLVSSSGPEAMGFGWWTLPLIALMLGLLVVLRWRNPGRLPAKAWIIAGAPLLGCIAFIAGKAIAGSYFYPRFVIAALPSFLALVTLLFAEAVGDVKARGAMDGGRLSWRCKLACAFTWLMALFVMPCWVAQAALLKTRPYAPLHDVAVFAQGYAARVTTDGTAPVGKPLHVCYGHGCEVLPVYLPEVRPALSRADLEQHMARARQEKRPLLVFQGHNVHNRSVIPDGFEILDDRTLFDEIASFAGIEPEFYFRVFEMK